MFSKDLYIEHTNKVVIMTILGNISTKLWPCLHFTDWIVCFLPSWCSCWRWFGCPGRDCLQWLSQTRPEWAERWAGCPVAAPAVSGGHWVAEPGPEASAGWTGDTGKAAVPKLMFLFANPKDKSTHTLTITVFYLEQQEKNQVKPDARHLPV